MAHAAVDFTQPWRHSDIIFTIDDKRIHANKSTLCMCSPVLEALFSSEFKEKNSTEIPLPGKNADDFIELMSVVHPPPKPVDGANVYRILPLADEYRMDHLIQQCADYLLTKPPSLKHLVLADKYDLEQLRKVCVKHVKTIHFSDLESMEDYTSINSETLIEILTHILKLNPTKRDMKNIRQKALFANNEGKPRLLLDCLSASAPDTPTLVFVNKKSSVNSLQQFLMNEGYRVTKLHGHYSQQQCDDAVRTFSSAETPILISRAVAAQALKIPNVKNVIMFDLPNSKEEYTHCIGLAWREDNMGLAISFFNRTDFHMVPNLKYLLQEAQQEISSDLSRMSDSLFLEVERMDDFKEDCGMAWNE